MAPPAAKRARKAAPAAGDDIETESTAVECPGAAAQIETPPEAQSSTPERPTASADTASAVAALSMLQAAQFDPKTVRPAFNLGEGVCRECTAHSVLQTGRRVHAVLGFRGFGVGVCVRASHAVGQWQFMMNLANSSADVILPLSAPVLVKSDGTRVQLDSSALKQKLSSLSQRGAQLPQASPVVDTSALSRLSDVAELSPMTPRPALADPDAPSDAACEPHPFCGEQLSSEDVQAIAALQALGSTTGVQHAEGLDLVLPGSVLGVNSRHGAARGRAVTRSCPGCSGRISIACKHCSLCGYKFRGREGGMPSSSGTTPRNTPTGSMLPPPLSPDLGGAVSHAHQDLSPDTFPNTPIASKPSTPSVTGAEQAEVKAEGSGQAAVGDGDCGGDDRSRPTVTRITPTSLELHKKKEQV
jgi:hypothetical protein